MKPWSVVARNLPEHAGNRIHTDEGAREAGFPAALVAGVTTYAYLTRLPAQRWGVEWVRSGGGEVRFAAPVFAGDTVHCLESNGVISAIVGGATRATFAVEAPGAEPLPRIDLVAGEELDPLTVTLDGEWQQYGARTGEDLALYEQHQVVHPAVWPALANSVFHAQVVRGSWVHTRSIVRHHDTAGVGEAVVVRTVVTRRFSTRVGERAVARVSITGADRRAVASIEHEAIVALADE